MARTLTYKEFIEINKDKLEPLPNPLTSHLWEEIEGLKTRIEDLENKNTDKENKK